MNTPSKALGIALSFLLSFGSIQGATTLYSTTLDAPTEADPTNTSLGAGSATFTYDDVLNTLAISVMFSGLTGTTTVAHIHAVTAMPFTGNAGVATQTPSFNLFPAGVMEGTYDNTFDLSAAGSYNAAFITANDGSVITSKAALLSAMTTGNAYLNVHTTYRPGGEIRGYISPVPDASSTLALLMPALLVGMGLAYRQRNRV